MTARSEKTILFISNRFGYGPTITLAHVMRQFASNTDCRLVFAGSGICKEAFDRQSLGDRVSYIEADERDLDDILKLIGRFDASRLFLVSCLNRLAIQAAHERGIPNALIDFLTWLWNTIPDGYLLADRYFSNSFATENRLPQMIDIPLILGPVPSRRGTPGEYFLFNIGGTQNHLVPELPKNYLRMLSSLLNRVRIPQGLRTVIAGGKDAVAFLKENSTRQDFSFESLSSEEYVSIQRRSSKIVSLAGTNSTFMSFAIGVPVIFLLPQLLAHWKLTDLLEERGYITPAQKWSDYVQFDEDADEITEKESILLTERLSAIVLSDQKLMDRITNDLQSRIDSDVETAGQDRFISEAGIGGEHMVCESLRTAWDIS